MSMILKSLTSSLLEKLKKLKSFGKLSKIPEAYGTKVYQALKASESFRSKKAKIILDKSLQVKRIKNFGCRKLFLRINEIAS